MSDTNNPYRWVPLNPNKQKPSKSLLIKANFKLGMSDLHVISVGFELSTGNSDYPYWD